MLAIFNIAVPVFCVIALGYAAARTGYLSEAIGDGLADFVLKIAVPVLLMHSLATAQFEGGGLWSFLAVYFSAVALAWLAAFGLIAGIVKRGYRASVIAGLGAAFSNLVLLGVPLVERAYGQDGLQILLFLIAFHLPVMMAVSTFLMEHAVRADGVEDTPLRTLDIARKLTRNLMLNPVIIGILAGFIWRLSGVGVGALPGEVMELLARTTGPLALFSLGMGLIKYGIKGNVLPAIGLAALSLLFMPAVVYLIGTTLIVLQPLWLKVAVLAASSPTGVNAYLIAAYFKIGEGLASNTIVLTLLGAVLTVPFWLSVVP